MIRLLARLGLAAALASAALAAPARADDPGAFQMWGSSGRWQIVSAPGMCSARIPDSDRNAGLMLSVLDGTGQFVSVSKAVPSLPQTVVIVLTLPDGSQQRIATDWNAEFKDGLHDVMGNHVLKPEEAEGLRGAATLNVEGLDGYEPVTLAPGEIKGVLDSLDRCMRMQK